jgi:hypothetical protein
LSIFSALHNFQATAIEAGMAAQEDRVPPESLQHRKALILITNYRFPRVGTLLEL